ncbi:MAG TPA: hypothetical protein VK821_07315 [Dehalococcoidia bacterium]|nr:hypothetical protein [Dehalococcoidia bacterium]
MRFLFSRIVTVLRAAALIRRPGRLVAGAMAIATLAMLSSRALPTSADLPYTIVYGVNPSPIRVTTSEAVAPVVSQGAGVATDSPPDSCWDYDSWCAYCTYHTSAVCTAYPPGKKPASAPASSTTPGVGSPSTTPAGGSAAPVGGGGTSGGGGAAPYTPPR